MKILVVEDEELIRVNLASCLISRGYEVETAADQLTALTRLAHEQVDLLITDNDLQHRDDGLTLICDGKAMQPHMRVIFMSGRLLDGDTLAIAAKSIGADVCLPKPFKLEELGEAVERLIGGATLQAA